jgi:hypothetical protein
MHMRGGGEDTKAAKPAPAIAALNRLAKAGR